MLTSNGNKLRFYIEQAIMRRDYAALAVFEGRLGTLEEPRSNCAVACGEDKFLSEAPLWAPGEFTSR